MNWFKLFVWDRKFRLLWPDEAIFYRHSRATVIKNGKIWAQNVKFVGKGKSLNQFNISGKKSSGFGDR